MRAVRMRPEFWRRQMQRMDWQPEADALGRREDESAAEEIWE